MGRGHRSADTSIRQILQVTMSCPRALSRQVAGAGCRSWCWCCELAVHVVETGCWCQCWCWVPRRRCWCCELAVRAVETGCWSWCRAPAAWLRTWWRQVAGAGRRVPVLVLAWRRQVVGAGAGCWCWCWVPACRCWCLCCELAVHVVETGCWSWCRRCGAVSWLRTWWRQVTGGPGRRAPVLAAHVVQPGWWWWCRVPALVL